MKQTLIRLLVFLVSGCLTAHAAETVTLRALLTEMTDLATLARFPASDYQCLQASSYNRASTNRSQPDQNATGWFADSDGLGFIRTEKKDRKEEWVIMEQAGPGVITQMWTPFL